FKSKSSNRILPRKVQPGPKEVATAGTVLVNDGDSIVMNLWIQTIDRKGRDTQQRQYTETNGRTDDNPDRGTNLSRKKRQDNHCDHQRDQTPPATGSEKRTGNDTTFEQPTHRFPFKRSGTPI